MQYKLGGEQWHNLTDVALKYIKRENIEYLKDTIDFNKILGG